VSSADATFLAEPISVSAARRFVADTISRWNVAAFEWAAVTLVSELATNAVLHAHTGFVVTLRLTGDVLRLSVSDESGRLPQPRAYGLEATTGRGLKLLRQLSASNGVEVTAAGKTVWCELRASADPGSGEREHTAAPAALFAGGAVAPADEDLSAFLAELDVSGQVDEARVAKTGTCLHAA